MTLEEAIETLAVLEERLPSAPGEVRLEGNRIVIHGPRTRGALTVGMMRSLGSIVAKLRADAGGLVVLSGTEGSFCSGGHLGQVRAGLIEVEAGRQMCAAMTRILDGLATLPQIVVAAVDGPALGGGAELLTAVDHRVLSPRARVGFVHGRLGVTPGWGGAARLVRWVGPRVALRWLGTAAVLEPVELASHVDAIGPFPETLRHFLARYEEVEEEALRGAKAAILAEAPLRRTGGEAAIFEGRWGGPLHRSHLGL